MNRSMGSARYFAVMIGSPKDRESLILSYANEGEALNPLILLMFLGINLEVSFIEFYLTGTRLKT